MLIKLLPTKTHIVVINPIFTSRMVKYFEELDGTVSNNNNKHLTINNYNPKKCV